MTQAFDARAESYDAWYDSPDGRAIFKAELACLRLLIGQGRGRWLEVGVGSGRFAANLGVSEGIDPSSRMLEKAAGRGIRTHEGYAEALPFPESAFDGALMALALCFVADSGQALKECFRVLRPDGKLLIGIVSADSPWGRAGQRKAAEGHPIYAYASFHTASETTALAESAGFEFRDSASTLFWKPTEPAETEPRIELGIVAEAGFIGLLFTKPKSQSPRKPRSRNDK